MSDRLIRESYVIKIVDKHTLDSGELDDDISCIIEEVPTTYDVDKVVEQLGK